MGSKQIQEETHNARSAYLADSVSPPRARPDVSLTAEVTDSLCASFCAQERSKFLQETVAYMERHHVQDILDDLLKQVIVHRPDDPIKHMIAHLKRPPIIRIIVLGPPGSQRKAICEKLAKEYGLLHIDAGEAIKAYLRRTNQSDLMTELQPGKLVPDEVAIPAVLQHLNSHLYDSYILDGFPRTSVQSIALQENRIFPDKLVILDVPFTKVEASILLRKQPRTALSDQQAATTRLPNSSSLGRPSESKLMPKTEEIFRFYQRHIHGIMEQYKSTYHIVDTAGDIHNVMRKIKMLGPPASGKTTQCKFLAEWYGVVHVDAVQLLRRNVSICPAFGLPRQQQRGIRQQYQRLKSPGLDRVKIHDPGLCHTTSGQFPALNKDTVLPLVLERLQQPDCMRKGWVIESFPETAEQAELLREAGFTPTQIIFFEVESSTQRIRIAQRHIDSETGEGYHDPLKESESRERLHTSSLDNPDYLAKRTTAIQQGKEGLMKAFRHGVTTLSSSDIHSPENTFNRILEHIERTL